MRTFIAVLQRRGWIATMENIILRNI